MKTDLATTKPAGTGDDLAEIVLEGVGVSSGVAIGTAYVVETALGQVAEYKVPIDQVEAEVARFHDAVAKARRQIDKLKRKSEGMSGSAAEELGLLLDAHGAMLASSRMNNGVIGRIRESAINAEAAVQGEIRGMAVSFAAMQDAYLAARIQDVRDIGARIIRQLTARPFQAFSRLQPGTVVLADELSPADAALLDPDKVAAFVTALGGAEGHTAIMARSMGLPAVLGAPRLLAAASSGQTVIVDGEAGRVVINPKPATIAEYERRQEARRRLERQLARLRALPATTVDGIRISLQANIELPRDLEAAQRSGAEGVGLLRTEFLFMNRDDLPSEDEQYAALRQIIDGMAGYPVTIRTLDVGGEKLATALGDRIAASPNPALGLRAIRFSLTQSKLFETQLAAILRASVHGPVRILLPMISSVQQVRQTRKIIDRLAKRMRKKGVEIPEKLPPLGAMIEIPAAALIADTLAGYVDFFAIGTNDLTQYTLAIDRGDEQVASLYNPLHPAVLRLIQLSIDGAQRHGIPISICGEVAGDPTFAALLTGLGVRDLSMSARSLPRVKQRIRALDIGPATKRAQAIMDQGDEGRISILLQDFNDAI